MKFSGTTRTQMQSLMKHFPVAYIVSPAWPSSDSGYGLAIRSSLEVYANTFQMIHFIGCVSSPIPDESRSFAEKIHSKYQTNIVFSHISVPIQPTWLRYFLSVGQPWPAVSYRFHRYEIRQQIIQCLKQNDFGKGEVFLIVEDVPLGSLALELRQHFPRVPIAIRSHNVLSKAFENLHHKNSLSRLAWRHEILRITKLENRLLKAVDKFWAISTTDFQEYQNRYGTSPSGVLGVSIDANNYSKVEQGEINTVLHLGSADIRKADGLSKFIDKVWPFVLQEVPSARLLLGGRNTERFTVEADRVYGIGYVEDVVSILDQGMIFINPQESGSGIKLKSIVALLAGKVLVSTSVGVEGLAGRPEVHYVTADVTQEMATRIVALIQNKQRAASLAETGQKMARDEYSQEKLQDSSSHLLRSLITARPSQ